MKKKVFQFKIRLITHNTKPQKLHKINVNFKHITALHSSDETMQENILRHFLTFPSCF